MSQPPCPSAGDGQQPPYGQQPDPYGQQDQYGQPLQKGKGGLIALVVGVVVVIAAIVVGLVVFLGRDDDTSNRATATTSAAGSTSTSSSGSASATSSSGSSGGGSGLVRRQRWRVDRWQRPPGASPDGLGTDTALNALASSCSGGSMDDCDALYVTASADTQQAHHDYGDSCAGYQPTSTGVTCRSAFGD